MCKACLKLAEERRTAEQKRMSIYAYEKALKALESLDKNTSPVMASNCVDRMQGEKK